MGEAIVQETSAGGVVVRQVEGRSDVCLVLRERHGRAWSLPKGHLEAGEDPATAALREVLEETGLHAKIVEPLGTIAYQFRRPEQGVTCAKTVIFFLMRATGGRLGARDPETVEARWMTLDEAMGAVTYDNERRLLERAKQRLVG